MGLFFLLLLAKLCCLVLVVQHPKHVMTFGKVHAGVFGIGTHDERAAKRRISYASEPVVVLEGSTDHNGFLPFHNAPFCGWSKAKLNGADDRIVGQDFVFVDIQGTENRERLESWQRLKGYLNVGTYVDGINFPRIIDGDVVLVFINTGVAHHAANGLVVPFRKPLLYIERLSGRVSQGMSINAPALHLGQLAAHNTPLEVPYDGGTEREKRNGPSEAYHPPFAASNSVLESIYLGLHVLGGYGLCCLGIWLIWRDLRIGRLSVWVILLGVLFYIVAGAIVWHGLIVSQQYSKKDLTNLDFRITLIPVERGAMGKQLERAKQIVAIGALAEGSSIRSIERMTGVHRDTIMRLGVRVGQGCARLLDRKMRGLSCQQLQFDEVWGFIGKKQRHVRPDDDPQYGDVWTFCAIDSATKLVPSFKVGKRDSATANAFVQDTASRLSNRVQISSDALRAYVDAVELAFGTEVDFAQIVKTYIHDESQIAERKYSAAEFVISEKIPVVGSPNMALASTSYIERLNGTTRLHMRRLTRLTYAFSKRLEHFEAAVGLHFAYYNLVKRHGTLRMTPAMAAGIERDFWTVDNLIEAAA